MNRLQIYFYNVRLIKLAQFFFFHFKKSSNTKNKGGAARVVGQDETNF